MMKRILEETRWLLARGWTQLHYLDESGTKFCVRGAFNETIINLGIPWVDCFHATEKIKNDPRVMEHCSLVSWNDHPSTTHAEILDVFDKAIASCK